MAKKHKATSASEPSARASLKSLEQALQDQGCAGNGKDYHEEALEREIARKRQAKADREIAARVRELEDFDFAGPDRVRAELAKPRVVVLPPYPQPKPARPALIQRIFQELQAVSMERAVTEGRYV